MNSSKEVSNFKNPQIVNRLPKWIRPTIGKASELEQVQRLVKEYRLHTICEEGRCPNRKECYSAGTATFLIGGSICTRSCAFCQVDKGKAPEKVDLMESQRIAKVIKALNLKYVVLTSVARDDLPDHGASLFCQTIKAIRSENMGVLIEVLTPDLWGGSSNKEISKQLQRNRLSKILNEKPICFNHNLETVERLQRTVRRGATYPNSLGLLKAAKEIAPQIPTKSGLMLGLGENLDEIVKTLEDLRNVNCEVLTLGQYLRPSLAHLPVQHYWTPKDFQVLKEIALNMGFAKVNSGPLVRSSYHASEN